MSSFNKLTDDFELIEVEEIEEQKKPPLSELDILSLIVGARDYDYLMDKNRFKLDNEVTSLYPLTSYQMLHFITFLISQIDPYIHHLFRFRKDDTYGVYSDTFHDILEELARKYPLPTTDYVDGHIIRSADKGFMYSNGNQHIAYNLNNREFSYLRLHKRPLILQHYFPYNVKPVDKLSKLYTNTEMLTRTNHPAKHKFRRVEDISPFFKKEILLYLPRFYFNVYSHYYDLTRKIASVNQLKAMADMDISEYATKQEWYNTMFSLTEKQKMYFSLGIDEIMGLEFLSNLEKFFAKIGANIEIKVEDFVDITRGKRREEPITDVYELYEFMIKSILVRRPPQSFLNTPLNRTNGVYLLNKGVGRLRNLVLEEVFNGANFEYIHVTDRYIEIKYSTKRKKIPFTEIADFSTDCLLNKRFVALIDKVYEKYPVHRILKFAEVYTRLFNQLGNDGIWYLLGTELVRFTNLDYIAFLNKMPCRFDKFEDMIFGKKWQRTYPPKGTVFLQTGKKIAKIFGNGGRFEFIKGKYLLPFPY